MSTAIANATKSPDAPDGRTTPEGMVDLLAREVLEAIYLLGGSMSLSTLARAVDSDPWLVGQAARRLQDVGMVTVERIGHRNLVRAVDSKGRAS